MAETNEPLSKKNSDSIRSQSSISLPTMMRAITIPQGFSFANPAKAADLVLAEHFPVPVPTGEQCLIRVHATGISRYELNWQISYTSSYPLRIPCFDVAGTIISSPKDCVFKTGDKVFGLPSLYGQGCMCQYAVSEARYLVRIPDWKDPVLNRFPFEYAAVLPRAALTAWQALKVELGGVLKPGMSMQAFTYSPCSRTIGRTH
jgi:NADPH:quinone reductase-like Zn-dependent oxidoreductase